MRTVQLSTFANTCSSEMRNSYFCRYFKTLCRWRDQYVNTSGLFWLHCIKQQQQQHTLFAFPITNGIAKV